MKRERLAINVLGGDLGEVNVSPELGILRDLLPRLADEGTPKQICNTEVREDLCRVFFVFYDVVVRKVNGIYQESHRKGQAQSWVIKKKQKKTSLELTKMLEES